ncbi:MAG: hypothetical protein AMXMBFR13_20310 [Phycisphaerae bacterium]
MRELANMDRYRLIVDSAEDFAIFMLDPHGHILSWNPGAQQITGYGDDEVIGQHFSILFTPEDMKQNRPQQEMQQAQALGRAVEEQWHLRKDGGRFWASGILTAMRDEAGELVGFSKVMRDITDRKRTEEMLDRQARDLARSNAELEEFAAVISHDLRSPLLAIGGCAQLIKDQYTEILDDEGRELIDMIQDGVGRMGRIIRDLLSFARATSISNHFVPVQAEAILEQAEADLREQIEKSGALITHDPLPPVIGNETQLAQVLTNLIGNAIKYRSQQPPRVHVSAERRGGEWLFRVRDNGMGIEPEHHQRIFAMFQRLHGDGDYEGTGIGLSICKKIVEHHGGRIWVESRPGDGSLFQFTIPA